MMIDTDQIQSERDSANIDNLIVAATRNFGKVVEMLSDRSPKLTPEQADAAKGELGCSMANLNGAIEAATQ